jgi:hypothetical protein
VTLGMKKSAFKLRFALIWITLSLGVVFVSIFPNILSIIASALGIKLVSNFVFAVAIFTLGLVILILTVENNTMQKRIIELASASALLEYRVRTLEIHESGKEHFNE